MTDKLHPKRTIVTGASGELGQAITRQLARPGARLSLWGRDHEKLAAIAAQCSAKGALVDVRSLDLTDVEGAVAALLAEDDVCPFDMAIFASGLGDIRAQGALVENPAQVARLIEVNFTAPAAMSAAIAGRMAERKGGGRLVLISSAAAFHALPFAASYAGSKAGLSRFTDSLRIAMRPHGVSVTLASPGFIDTAAGRSVPGARPMPLAPEEAARRILRAAMAGRNGMGRAHLITPWHFALLRLFDRALPRFLRDRLLRSLAPPGW